MKKRLFSHIKTNLDRHFEEDALIHYNDSYTHRIYLWFKGKTLRSDIEIERTKFIPEILRLNTYYNQFLILIGVFLGFNVYLYKKKIYAEDHILRDPGYRIKKELLGGNYGFLYFRIYLSALLRTSLLMNYELMYQDKRNLSANEKSFNINPRKEICFKAFVADIYLKKRSELYDFAHLGELEEIFVLFD